MSARLFTTPSYKVDGVTYNHRNGTMSVDPQVMTVGGGKKLDANQYATKKTVAQGMLDVALLTANASQLKYVLEVGEKHPYYTVMLVLIISSLILQGMSTILLGVLAVFNINKPKQQYPSVVINHVVMGLSMLTMALDAIQTGFDNGFRPMKNSTTFIP